MRRLASCWAEAGKVSSAKVARARRHMDERRMHLYPRLFIADLSASIGNQFVNQRRARLHVAPDQALGAFDPCFQGGDAQFVVLDPQHDFVSRVDAKSLTKGCRNNIASPSADTGSAFVFHNLATLQMNGGIL